MPKFPKNTSPFRMKGISPLKHPHPEHPHKKSKKVGTHPATHPDYFKDKESPYTPL